MTKYRHKKTGNIYLVFASAVDCTNSRDGTIVIVYRPAVTGNEHLYVREEREFYEKFEKVE